MESYVQKIGKSFQTSPKKLEVNFDVLNGEFFSHWTFKAMI